MNARRTKINESMDGTYHCMTRTVNGEMLFKNREKEMLRKMMWQVADFCGVQILTYCVMSNHFHVLLRVPAVHKISDAELMRRYSVLYPNPTKHQAASASVLTSILASNSEEATEIRHKLLARMGDVSQYMKTLKQRFSFWYNHCNQRFGTLWAERFKSVLVEGEGNPLQTMAAYIDLNPVRAGIVEDPKDYRFCGYAEAVAGDRLSAEGLVRIWKDRLGTTTSNLNPNDAVRCISQAREKSSGDLIMGALRAHRMLIFGKGASPWTYKGKVMTREQAVKAMEEQQGELPMCTMLRCRVRYFTDGAILGSAEFVRCFTDSWQRDHARQNTPTANALKGGNWGDLAVIQGMRSKLFD